MAEASDSDHDHEHQAVPSDMALRVKALESLLVEKGLVDQAALDVLIDTYEHKVGPRNGARVVARARNRLQSLVASSLLPRRASRYARPSPSTSTASANR